MSNSEVTEKLLTTETVAQILSLSKRTVHRLNNSGLICRPLRVSGSVRYIQCESCRKGSNNVEGTAE